MFTGLDYLRAVLTVHLGRARDARQRNEYGVSAVEWVIITAALVFIAGAVFAILSRTIQGEARNIDLDAP